MPPKCYRVVWRDQAISLVTIDTDDRGYAVVKINGTAERLNNLHDYRTVSAVELELFYSTRKVGAKLIADARDA